jgi:hypothetical protein
MGIFFVTGPDIPPRHVHARNWLLAASQVLDESGTSPQGRAISLHRRTDGAWQLSEVSTGRTFVVRRLGNVSRATP